MKREAKKKQDFNRITRIVDKYSGSVQDEMPSVETDYDELLNALELAGNTSARLQIDLLIILTRYCLANLRIEESEQYLQRVFTLIKAGEKSPRMGDIFFLQGKLYQEKKEVDAALAAYNNALALADSEANPNQAAKILKAIGTLFFGQGRYKDAIEIFLKQSEVLRKTGEKSDFARALGNAGISYLKDNQYDLALSCLNEARELYSNENMQEDVNRLDNYIGMVHFWKADYPQAIATYRSALERLDRTDIDYANILVQIGTTYQYLGDYAKSLQYLLESIKLRQEHHKGYGLASNYLCLGVSYYTVDDYDKAEECYNLALNLFGEQNNMDGALKAQVNLGITAKAKNNPDKALEYFLPVQQAAKVSNDQYLYSNVISNIASVYSDQDEYHKALVMYEEALAIKQKMGHQGDEVKIHFSISEQHLALQDYTAAEKSALKGIELAEKLGIRTCISNGFELLSQLYELQKNYKKALAYHKQFMKEREILTNERTKKNISEIKIKYDTLAKEKEAELQRQKALELQEKNKEIELQKQDLQETLDKLYNSEIRYNFVSDELSRNIRSTLIGSSETIRSITKMIAMVAKSDKTNVLITGETGTGKEIVARSIHRYSNRGRNHFYAVNCTAVPENLFESHFFGHEKNAFTGANSTKVGWFEIASNSTLFLDEIGSLSFDQQAKLLRVLEESCIVRVGSHREIPVDLRVISATNVNLSHKVELEEFRRDLYHRLAIFVINIPPLREHREDIPLLLKHFVGLASQSLNKKISRVEKDVIVSLSEYDFPGNVRELRNLVERAVLVADSSTLRREHFLIPLSAIDYPKQDKILTLDTVERNLIIRALQATGYNQVQAAKLLGVDRKVVSRKILKHNIHIATK
jgi:transcriptional regulator with GAF, ATPase, and Fis domain